MHIHPNGTAALESDVIRRAQNGDADAFADLFNRHKGRVYALCLRMTKNAAEAEDLTQEAFLHVFRKLSAFRLDSALSTWLYRVTTNTVLMHFRRRSLRQFISERSAIGEEHGTPVPREFPSVDLRLAGCVDRVALNRALVALPKGYRRVFMMHELEGYEHREIAESLGCSVGNSKSQLHKARLRIREILRSPGSQQSEENQRTKATDKSEIARSHETCSLDGALSGLPVLSEEMAACAQAA